jgi:long-chain fatty acid transport protein
MMFWVAAAFAGGFEVAQQGAATAGTAHAGTAVVGSAESAWFNPAALADNGGFRLSVGATLAYSRITARSLIGAPGEPYTTSTNSPIGVPPWLYLSYSRANWAVALSANAPFAGGARWPADGPLRFDAVLTQPQFFRAAGSFAYRFGPIRLGAGLHVDTGSLRIEKATDHVSAEGYATILLRDTGLGGDAYLLANAGKHATIGLTYKSRTRLNLAGEADFDVPAAFASQVPDTAVTAPWMLPDRLTLGFAWTADRWMATVEAGLTLWSVNQQLALDFADPAASDTTQVNAWRDAVALRAGAMAKVHDLVDLRVGAWADGLAGAPPPTEYLGPSSPDGTRLGATAGLGIQAHRAVRIDLFAEPLVILRRAATSENLPPASYGGWAFTGGLGLTVTVPRSPVAAGEIEIGPAGVPIGAPVWSAPVPQPEPPAEPSGEPPAEPPAEPAPPTEPTAPIWTPVPKELP